MSKVAQRGATSVKRAAPADDGGDICPVCKSSRYLNPQMKFMVNPECYHKMCESCVDRIFSSGPAPCPIAGCRRTLRKAKFRPQLFEDLRIEKEVDIRRTLSKIVERRESTFATLLEYNNFLNEIEDLTFDMINGINLEKCERKLEQLRGQKAAQDAAQQEIVMRGRKSLMGGVDESEPYSPYGGLRFENTYSVHEDDYDVRFSRMNLAGGYKISDFYHRSLTEGFGGLGVFISEEFKGST